MTELQTGMFARSLAGHDKGRLYVVVGTEGEWVWLADGRHRTVEHPKKKKRKHLQPDYTICTTLAAQSTDSPDRKNAVIREAIKSKEEQGCQRPM